MKLTITVDVNAKCSGYKNDNDLRDNISDFVYDWLVNGAENQHVDFSVKSIKSKSKRKDCREVCKWQY